MEGGLFHLRNIAGYVLTQNLYCWLKYHKCPKVDSSKNGSEQLHLRNSEG